MMPLLPRRNTFMTSIQSDNCSKLRYNLRANFAVTLRCKLQENETTWDSRQIFLRRLQTFSIIADSCF